MSLVGMLSSSCCDFVYLITFDKAPYQKCYLNSSFHTLNTYKCVDVKLC